MSLLTCPRGTGESLWSVEISIYSDRLQVKAHIPLALLFFSLGVEAGHFLFLGAVLALIALLLQPKLAVPQWLRLVPPYAIGAVAAYWVIARVAALGS